MNFNKVILLGNLTRTPELRSTPGGTQVCDLTLAVNENYTDSSGQKQERASFVNCVAWGKSAETLCRWKKQGDPLLIEGRLQQDTWVDKQSGQNRSKLKVVVSTFVFVPRGQGKNNAGENKQHGKSARDQFQDNEGYGPGPGGYDDYATSLPDGGEEPPF